VERLSREVDEFVVLDPSPYYLGAVGAYYDHFLQVTDEEVVALLRLAAPEGRVKEHGHP
jgi:predicted phosphoribosyltransferase